MEKSLKEILGMNSKNKLSSHLIILIYTLNNINLNLNIEYYNRGFIRRAFTFNVDRYCNTSKDIEIDIDLLIKYLDILENNLKIIANKYKVEKNIFKLYYIINYPLKICYTKIRNYYK
ncbi:hypothetical protein LRB59_05515 [Borreliella burgdorferi]|uniref:Uncharacterized protein n=2 Tax=Borreliella TaxID=64895 RepID=Q9S019_BORBU|nr:MULTISPECIES: hypothetical protein [Borreliella]AAF08546.1 conserved hypothetical protein [Borreliella burgdorferi B31]ACN55799.1 conserved hypothetical protein [Borreliella burgdorferi WI91-23]MCD2320955.1 hypothetical protein [Borreliella burgdorferi]MCD2331508.1 hypothetical protein [Borreliella burgdorferi]MCD2408853.1 hypothetical protein [Borreliella burgdorferi]